MNYTPKWLVRSLFQIVHISGSGACLHNGRCQKTDSGEHRLWCDTETAEQRHSRLERQRKMSPLW